ncbi:MAG: hypothetical protein JOZ31_25035 [Verrucomicrobia bacterium]|nr:hypothetical protein [Verrucomicrobiota bacterium]
MPKPDFVICARRLLDKFFHTNANPGGMTITMSAIPFLPVDSQGLITNRRIWRRGEPCAR